MKAKKQTKSRKNLKAAKKLEAKKTLYITYNMRETQISGYGTSSGGGSVPTK